MNNNIIIVGDSFCAFEGWGEVLAKELGCNLFRRGFGGHSWWTVRWTLQHDISQQLYDNTEYIVFCHTIESRLLKPNNDIAHINPNDESDKREIAQAVRLYYKYIYDESVAHWTQEQWFREISNTYYRKYKLIHLHCFPWSWDKRNLLKGMNIGPSLTAISLNELNATSLSQLAFCGRPNHLNEYNNTMLGQELAKLINNYQETDVFLDLTKFEQQTNKWTDWK